MPFQSFSVLKLLILICTLLLHTGDVKEISYNNVKSNLNLIDFYHVLNISLISNDKQLGQIKFKHLSQLKNLIPNFTWDLVATSSHDPQKVIFNFSFRGIFNFSFNELSSSDKDLLSKGLRFAIAPKQIDYSNFMTKFELLYRSTLYLSMTTEGKDRFETKLKHIVLSSFKLINEEENLYGRNTLA